MTVEQSLRGYFEDIGDQISLNTLGNAVRSPIKAKPVKFRVISLDDDVDDFNDDEEFQNSFDYALSTLYYSMSGWTGGGTKSEQRGNRRISIGGKAIDVATREAWRRLGDFYRGKTGSVVDESAQLVNDGGMDDYTYKRSRPNTWRKGGWR